MSSPTGRRLEALAMLRSNPGITAVRLAARLQVTERTARRDVAHLRALGYRIDAEPGRYGGYTLAAGTAMPPLVLDADEALAVALGLRASHGIGDLAPAAVTALAKLTETVPTRLRGRLQAIAGTAATREEGALAADLGWAARWLVYRNIDFDVLAPRAHRESPRPGPLADRPIDGTSGGLARTLAPGALRGDDLAAE